MDNEKREPASPARGLFTNENRARLLEQVVGSPSGFVVEIGGAAFDLVPLSSSDGRRMLAILDDVTATWQAIQGGKATEADIFAALGDKLPIVFDMAKRILQESAGITAEQQPVFDEWFEGTRFIPMLKALVPTVLRANGFEKIADKMEGKDPSKPAATSTSSETPAPVNA